MIDDIPRKVTVYNYNRITNVFVSEEEVPIKKNRPLIPANATLTKPPSEKEDFIRIYNIETSSWKEVEDHTGKKIYSIHNDGSTHTVIRTGPIPSGFTETEPPSKYHTWSIEGNFWAFTDMGRLNELEDAKKVGRVTIDSTYDALLTIWSPRFKEYDQKVDQARKYKDSNYTGVPGEHIMMLSRSAGVDPKQAALLILSANARMTAILEQLSGLRMEKFALKKYDNVTAVKLEVERIVGDIKKLGDTL